MWNWGKINIFLWKWRNSLELPKFGPPAKSFVRARKAKKRQKLYLLRRFARQSQRLGYNVRFANFKIHNCHGSVLLPFQIKIKEFSQAHQEASYEPELHTGIIYKVEAFSATLRIYRSGHNSHDHTGNALGIWISGCKRWCPKDLRVHIVYIL